MLERLLLPKKHAIAILMNDHDRVKDLFDKFEKAESATEKQKLMSQAVMELKIHAAIEEEIFYPTVRKGVGADIMNEADEEHHVARILIAELDRGSRSNDHREAKFSVLAESVKHHIREEEGEMLPKAKGAELNFEDLGEKMLERKRELKANGVPPDREHAMVAAIKGNGDSPAAAAGRKSPARRQATNMRSRSSAKASSRKSKRTRTTR